MSEFFDKVIAWVGEDPAWRIIAVSIGIAAVIIVGFIIYACILNWYYNNTERGRAAVAKEKAKATGGQVVSEGISHKFIDSKVLQYFNDEKRGSGCFGKKPACSDEEYDNLILNRIKEIASKEVALRRIGVDESQVAEIKPVCFLGFEEESGVLSRYGNDGRFRTSQYSVSWLFSGDNQIFVFSAFMDLLTHKTKSITREYFYKDITNFSSIFSNYEYEIRTPKQGCLSKGYDSALKKVEIQKFSITVPNDNFSCSVSGSANVERIILDLKLKLREKKGGRE